MTRLMKDFVAEMLYEPPKRAEPKVFCYRHVLDPLEMRMVQDGARYIEQLKRRAAHALADHIFTECQFFQIPEMRELMQGYPIQMELTINDRGSYEHIVPMAKHEGRKEGIRAGKDEVKRTIPYGFEPEQYYE